MNRRTLNIAGYVAIALVALVLWPQRFGGAMTYDITHGASMQPRFHTGDLAVLRKASAYNVGDIAAYRSPSLNTTVMHRIKAKTAKGYIFKGDNNSFVDPDTVTDREMLGRLLIRVPQVGRYLAWFLNPLHLALAAGGLFLLFADDKKNKRARGEGQPPLEPAPARDVEPVIVRITALRLPQELPTADVELAGDLHRLAQLQGIAVLRDATSDYLMQGGLLLRHRRSEPVVVQELRRRPSPHGRDWRYARRAGAEVVELSDRHRNVS